MSKPVTVPHVDDMDQKTFWLHMYLRHPTLRLVTRGEHEAHHRLSPTSLHRHLARTGKNPREQLSGKRTAEPTTVDRPRR